MVEAGSISGLAVSVFGRDGTIVSTSLAHAALVGRDIDGIVGHNWREWNVPHRVGEVDRLVQRAFSGEPTEFVRVVVRPDGSSVLSAATINLLHPPSAVPLVIALSKAVLSVAEIRSAAAASLGCDAAESVQELTEELAAMTSRVGLADLGGSLGEIAAHAGRLSKVLASNCRNPAVTLAGG